MHEPEDLAMMVARGDGMTFKERQRAAELIRKNAAPQESLTRPGIVGARPADAAPTGPGVIPEGWKLVPIVPTKEMIAVGDSIQARVDGGPPQRIHYPPAVGPEDVYAFMVEVAPSCGATGEKS